MDLRARWPWLLALVACRGDGCRCRGHADDTAHLESRPETGDDSACELLLWHADLDGDGYGDPNSPLEACEQPAQTAANDLDCDDENPEAWPGAAVVCNDLADNDCDGAPDCTAADGDAAPEDASAVLTSGEATYLGMGMALIDLNGDRERDLVLSDPEYADRTEDRVYLVLGPIQGQAAVWDAAFASLKSNRAEATGWVLQAGDLDGDDYPDLVLAQGYSELSGVWLASGPFVGEVSLSDDTTPYLGIEDTSGRRTSLSPRSAT